jgi:hypothetical protein
MGYREGAPARGASNLTVSLLAILTILSFGLHAVVILNVNRARNVVRAEAAFLQQELMALRDSGVRFTAPVSQTAPIEAQVPIRQRFDVPVDTVVTIDDSVTVPIETPFGSTSFSLPVRANIPIRVTVPVTIEETVDIATTVAVQVDVPIELTIAQTSVQAQLDALLERLARLQRDL